MLAHSLLCLSPPSTAVRPICFTLCFTPCAIHHQYPAFLLPLLLQLLSYHVVPAGAVRAAALTDGQRLTTLLEGAPALRVDIDEDDGKRQVEIEVG